MKALRQAADINNRKVLANEEIKMKWKQCGFLAISSVLVMACASVHKNGSVMNTKDYQARKQLSQSLLTVGGGGFWGSPENEAAREQVEAKIGQLLDGRIPIRNKVNLAVVRLGGTLSDDQYQPLDQEVANKFYDSSQWGPRVITVTPVPDLLLSGQSDFQSLRRSAALLQADMLLIISPNSKADWKFNMVQENRAKAVTHLDVLLMDVRTGTFPFTAIALEQVELKKQEDDYSNNELMVRAKAASEKKAYLSLIPKVQGFFQSIAKL